MGMTVLVIFGFDDFFELFFLQDAMIRTASIFNDLGEKELGAQVWIYSGFSLIYTGHRYRLKYI